MAEEAKTHTLGEVEIIKAITRVETLQCMMNDDFKDHKKEDDDHFDNLYKADQKILDEISLIPERMVKCSEKIKTETLNVARKEFVNTTSFEEYKGDVKESTAQIKGVLRTSNVVMGLFQTILLIIFAAWLKSKGL